MDLNASQPLAELSDEQLVELYRHGRTKAFEALVERYRQELFHFLVRVLGNRASADDIFQETFLQVHLSIETFDPTRRFKPWLFTIAANKARDQLRRNHRRPESPLMASVDPNGGDEDRQFVDLMENALPPPTEEIERSETQGLVRQTVAAMPEHLREILVLAYFHRFPYQEIAQMLGIPLGTVKSRLHAAVSTFSQLWKERSSPAPGTPGSPAPGPNKTNGGKSQSGDEEPAEE